MDLGYFAFFASVLSVAAFLLVERLVLSRRARWSKLYPLVAIHGLNLAVSLCLSAFVLVPFVFLVAPFQVFSFSQWETPVWVSFLASLLFLDLAHYALHYLQHKIPLLWRLHRLHHSDKDVDALTTLLHHPLEVVFGFLAIVPAAVVFDVPMVALVSYSALLGLHSAFTHMNHELSAPADRILKWFFITPNFHRIHHSRDIHAGNSNFGSVFVFWDYLFGTVFRAKRKPGKPTFGIDESQSPKAGSIASALVNPLK